MIFYPDTLTLNHQTYSLPSLLELCNAKADDTTVPEWEKDIYLFLEEWFSKKDSITLHTSGSTGSPKRIDLMKSWMIYSARQTCTYFELGHPHTALLCLPAAYIAGRMMIVRALVCGFNLISVQPSASPLANLQQSIDFAAITPYQLYHSLEILKKKSLVDKLIVGGGEIDAGLQKQIQNIPTKVYGTYGMTETSSHIALQRINGREKEDFFRVLGHTKITKDHRNCLMIENSGLFDGTLITNDIVEIKNDRQFKWMGRYDNIINSGGIKVVPEEVEKQIAHLREEPMVISSVGSKKFGESIVLVVEKESLSSNEKDLLLQQIKSLVHPYSMPKDVFCLSRFPQTPSGKTDRVAIKKLIVSS